MKKINFHLIIFMSLFFYLVGGFAADIGEAKPGYIINIRDVIWASTTLGWMFYLGWMASKNHYKE